MRYIYSSLMRKKYLMQFTQHPFFQIELFLLLKNTLNVHSYCEGAHLSTDLTCNLAFWHNLSVSMEIDTFYAILRTIPDIESVGCSKLGCSGAPDT